ncbi:MFS transporter [Bosea lathyri]|uniref:MFS transporter n=1 Tax=Bosea lathyri TaxID=1036778 RepID=UPI001359E5CF|nr:MFS transporter [Bosea lathyri]
MAATLFVQVISSLAAATIPLMGPLLTQKWGLPATSIGYASAASSAGICWFLACGNSMLDHYGPIRTIQIGLLALVLGLVVFLLPLGAIGLSGALLFGLGVAPNIPAGSQVLMRTAPPRHRTLVFSIKQAGMPLGGMIAGLIIPALVAGMGFNAGLFVLIAMLVMSAALVQPFQRALDGEKGHGDRAWPRHFLSPSSLRRAVAVIRLNRELPILTLICVSFSVAQSSTTAYTATYMVTEHGKSLLEAGQYMAVFLGASALARILFGWIADRTGKGTILFASLGLATGVALLLLISPIGSHPVFVYACMIMAGATTMGWNGVFMAEIARSSPPSQVGPVTSAVNLFGFFGSISGPLVFAVTATLTGGFVWPFVIIALQAALVGLTALWLLRRPPTTIAH